MRTHYIPKLYLKGFTNSKGKIWVYNRNRPKPFCTSPHNAGVISDYYSRNVERYLSQEVEGPAIDVIQKIRERTEITANDKERLAKYVVNLIMRVPHGKQRLRNILPNLFTRFFSESNLRRALHPHQLTKMQVLQLQILGQGLWNNREHNLDEWWSSLLDPDQFEKALTGLMAMSWQFLTFDSEPAFITSDNPVFFFQHIGIENPRSEVSIPISQNIALWASWNENVTQDYVPVAKEIVDVINQRTVTCATETIFSPVQASWLAAIVSPKHN